MAMVAHVPNVEGVADVDWKSKREVPFVEQGTFSHCYGLGIVICWLNKHT
jgi:hypothetical protein